MPGVEIPNRSLFKAPEVCEIAQLQPYVLRSWEAEFPDLGVSRAGAPRVYRRHDVERVLRLKHLLFVEGLTLAGARKRIEEESAPLPPLDDQGEEGAGTQRSAREADAALRRQLVAVRKELRSILAMLDRDRRARADAGFELRAEAAPPHAVQASRRPAGKPSPPASRAAKNSASRRRSR